MTDFDSDLYEVVLQEAWKESDAVWAEIQAFLKQHPQLYDRGQPMPQAEAQARFRQLVDKYRRIGERHAAIFDALWEAKTANP